jgi:hypothetical protein
MSLPKSKVNLYERRITRLKKRVAREAEIRADQRTHYGNVVAKHIATERGLNTTISQFTTAAIQDRFKIQELENQVALQWQKNAELGEDVKKYTRALSAARLENDQYRFQADHAIDVVEALERDIKELKLKLGYRARRFLLGEYQALKASAAGLYARTRLRWINTILRLRNRALVWRLNKARVSAISEGGYIPEKLIKLALQYWELDKERASETIVEFDSTGVGREARQTLWRRLRIWLGRA